MAEQIQKKPSRIQQRNRRKILDAALDVFSAHGFRGATLDQIAEQAGLSKPNILYYFDGKEEIHVTVLSQLMETWLDPLAGLDPKGDPLTEILTYVQRKLEMSRDLPRESRLFANEILQGAPRMDPHLRADLKPLFDARCAVIQAWMDAGKLAQVDPRHLIFSIWATTQHYADFQAQIAVLLEGQEPTDTAAQFLQTMFRNLLTPGQNSTPA
ncbi:TetR family transcriptional regulator C-terminal domain-containing protein [Sulfitobacter pseudonitzschiae]|uniref:TetR family transcriptional regulator C-terminal domain-containing protein n=1 Tax=Pseudosulfitobacter pseudonitzschiae TaxID=1402135 RepID=A0A9Q2RX02_9RHOB|nr:TetR family transcriptional regulator C-terminal domain-containing protein [Pseudosulfitobacter pseudonitzschiae]MBM2294405.1 TetR family transcriptional regulator C-terminal domain-containing protein [Pseudosulfitobacter pseudonitzschiae]MBM2299373.1 TetR family transcriptional regulator C-terminal domain-containing protein [Pseudosulfitobacter pseudonitzschiae]MBM2304237.1 TetR family transcriptional regulator C-terminal domain-containing protein [Pseudosulfitobacter pseudonitzschiae]MBM23